MPQGLWVGTPDGVTIFDQTTPVIKFLGTLSIGGYSQPAPTGSARTGSIYDPRFTQFAGHTPFWCRNDGAFNNEGFDAEWSFDGNYLTWFYPIENPSPIYINGVAYYSGRPNQRIIYGIR